MGVNKGRKEVNKERKGVNKDTNRGNMERKGVDKEDSLSCFPVWLWRHHVRDRPVTPISLLICTEYYGIYHYTASEP